MIDSLQGELVSKNAGSVTLALGGIGFLVRIPLSTYEALPAEGRPARLVTHLHVREDELTLYGFATELERDMFRMLMSVSRIGPLVAMRVVGSCPPDNFKRYVTDGDADALSAVAKGIGAKTAKRIIAELQGRVGDLDVTLAPGTADRVVRDTIQALMALGESRLSAEKAVHAALAKLGPHADQQALMQEALSH